MSDWPCSAPLQRLPKERTLEKSVYSELAIQLCSSLWDWLDLWSHMLGWLFSLMILQHANNSFYLKVLWPQIPTKPLLVWKLQFFCFQALWHSWFRIFVPFWHHDSNYVPVSLSTYRKNPKQNLFWPQNLLLCFNCASQRLAEFQFWKDSLISCNAWMNEKRNCLTYCTCNKPLYI